MSIENERQDQLAARISVFFDVSQSLDKDYSTDIAKSAKKDFQTWSEGGCVDFPEDFVELKEELIRQSYDAQIGKTTIKATIDDIGFTK